MAKPKTTQSGDVTYTRTSEKRGRYYGWRCSVCGNVVTGSGLALSSHARSKDHQRGSDEYNAKVRATVEEGGLL